MESREFGLICGIEDLEWIELELICRIKEALEWSEFVESRTWNRSTEWGTAGDELIWFQLHVQTFSFLFFSSWYCVCQPFYWVRNFALLPKFEFFWLKIQ